MIAPVTVDDLRAVCPTCHASVRVRRQGAAWRMVAHKRAVSSWGGSRDEACPVRDVDAVPLIAKWIMRMGQDARYDLDRAERSRATAAEATARAEAADEAASEKHRRIAEALRVAPAEAVAVLQAEAAKASP